MIGGAAAVSVAAVGLWAAIHALHRAPVVHTARRLSKRRRWALDLRLSLAALFLLTALATRLGTSILVAGFAAGAIVATASVPKRLTQQLVGLAEGFFVPLFFVVLGAQLDVRGLAGSPGDLALAGGLAVAVAVLHVLAGLMLRQRPAVGLVASAQLGVPAAVVSVGLSQGALTASQGAALIVGGAALAAGLRGRCRAAGSLSRRCATSRPCGRRAVAALRSSE